MHVFFSFLVGQVVEKGSREWGREAGRGEGKGEGRGAGWVVVAGRRRQAQCGREVVVVVEEKVGKGGSAVGRTGRASYFCPCPCLSAQEERRRDQMSDVCLIWAAGLAVSAQPQPFLFLFR